MLVRFLLPLLLLCHMAVSKCIQECKYYCGEPVGEVSVVDCSVFINKTINITCHLKENVTFNSSTLYFKRHETRLDDNQIIMVDNRTAVLPHIVTAEDRKKYFYCLSTSREALPVGHIQILYIDYYPQEVSDFHCIWEQLDPNNLSCFWKHPVEYDHRYLQVTLEWKTNEKEPYHDRCPSINNFTMCTHVTNINGGSDTFFRVNVTNEKMNVSTSTVIDIRSPNTLRDMYGKPKSPHNLRIITKNQTTVKLEWDRNGNHTIYFISYNSTYGEKTIETNETLSAISNLSTYTVYKFVVVAQYTDLLDRNRAVGIPSDPSSATVRTSQDVAKYPPIVTDGGFNVNMAGSSINVTVYWQNFKEMNLNGPIIKYEVILEYKDRTNRIQLNESGLSQYTFVVNKNESPLDSVRIKSGTEVGLSEASPPINIPKDVVNKPELLLEQYNENSNNFDIMLSWIPEKEKGAQGYTIYWREKNNGFQKQINWKGVDANITRYNLENLDINKSYFYGVSMEGLNTSTGFSWKGCYYKRDETPKNPKAVQMTKQETTKVTVTWTRPVCGELSPFIKYYILYWCPLIDNQKYCTQGQNGSAKINSSVSDMHMEYTISELKSGSKYEVWLEAVSSTGTPSQPGEINSNITTTTEVNTRAGDSSTVVILVVILVVIAIFAIVILLEIRCHRFRKFYRICCENPEIYLPKLEPRFKTNDGVLREAKEEMSTNQSKNINGYVIVGQHNNTLELSDEQTGHQNSEKEKFSFNEIENDIKERRIEISVINTSTEETTQSFSLLDDYTQVGKDTLQKKSEGARDNFGTEINSSELHSDLFDKREPCIVSSSCKESSLTYDSSSQNECLNYVTEKSLNIKKDKRRPTSEAKSLSSCSSTLHKDDYVLETDLLKKHTSLQSLKETNSSGFGTLPMQSNEIVRNGLCQFGLLSSSVLTDNSEVLNPNINSFSYEESANGIGDINAEIQSIDKCLPDGKNYNNSSLQSQPHIQLTNMNLIQDTSRSDKISPSPNKDDNVFGVDATLRSNNNIQESFLATSIVTTPKTNFAAQDVEFENSILSVRYVDDKKKNFDVINDLHETTHCKNSSSNNGYKTLADIAICLKNNNLADNIDNQKKIEKPKSGLILCTDENENCV